MKKLSLVSLAVIGCLGLGACEKVHDLSRDELDVANNGGLAYANGQGKRFLQCSGLDSNKDGYVTCSMKDERHLNEPATEFLCAYNRPGCKGK